MKREFKLVISLLVLLLSLLGIIYVCFYSNKDSILSYSVKSNIYMAKNEEDSSDSVSVETNDQETIDSAPTDTQDAKVPDDEKVTPSVPVPENNMPSKEENKINEEDNKVSEEDIKKQEEMDSVPLVPVPLEIVGSEVPNNDISTQEGNKPLDEKNETTKYESSTGNIETVEMSLTNKIIVVVLSVIFSLTLSYLIFSKLCLINPFSNKMNILFILLITIILSITISYFSIKLTNKSSKIVEKVTTETINLSDYNSDIEINKKGEYTLTGNLNGSIIVDSSKKVTLNLNNVTVSSINSPAIYSKKGDLVINIMDNSVNVLSNGGDSEYDGTLYSSSNLIINGKGSLFINGSQIDGEGIATKDADITINSGDINIISIDDGINAGGDKGGTITINSGDIYISAGGDGIDSNKDIVINDGNIFIMASEKGDNSAIDSKSGYKINGGRVVALTTNKLENPLDESKQKSLVVQTNKTIDKNQNITVVDSDNNEILSFLSAKNFDTIIISTKDILNTNYSVLVNTENTGNLKNGVYNNNTFKKGTKIDIKNQSIIE